MTTAGGETSGSVAQREPRPRQATLAAVLLAVFGLLGLLEAFLLLTILNNDASEGQSDPGILYVVCYFGLAVSALQVVSGLFVWQGRGWARNLAIWLCVLNLIGAVVSLVSGGVMQALLGLCLNGAMIRMLTRDEVSWWCR